MSQTHPHLTPAQVLNFRSSCPYYVHGVRNNYGYAPTLAAGIVFTLLFGLSMIGHTVQSVRYRKATSIVFAIGALVEVLGWAGRTWSAHCPYNRDAFLMQITTLIIAPTFFISGAYIILGKMIVLAGPKSSLLSPKMYLIVFVSCDFISLIVQAVGGAMASLATNKVNGNTKPGTNIMIVGIDFQLVAMTIFTALLFDFLRRARQSVSGMKSQRLVLGAMAISVLAIYIRSIYRTIELAQGWSGYLITRERYFVALDSSMMVIAVGIYNFIDPAVLLGRKNTDVGDIAPPHENPSYDSDPAATSKEEA